MRFFSIFFPLIAMLWICEINKPLEHQMVSKSIFSGDSYLYYSSNIKCTYEKKY